MDVTTIDATYLPIPLDPVSASATRRPAALPRAKRASQAGTLLGVIVTVACIDQLSKAWAWRTISTVHVNSGADMLVSATVGDWYRDSTMGALLDGLSVLALILSGLLLIRRRRSMVTLLGGALILAGNTSNLADRLGMHRLTAPGSPRGAIDFLQWQGRTWNLADLAIVSGTAMLVVYVLGVALHRAAGRPGIRPQQIRRALCREREARHVLATGLALLSILATTDLLT